MGTYFHGSTEIQAAVVPSDGIQTLYLMNPNYLSSHTDTTSYQQHHHHPPPTNMLFFNSGAATAACSSAVNLASNQHLLGIPLPAGRASNIWLGTVDQISSVAAAGVGSDPGGAQQDAISSQLGFRRPVATSPARQGLSLTLSTQGVHSQQQEAPYNRAVMSNEHGIQVIHQQVPTVSLAGREEMMVTGNSPSSASNAVSGMQSVVIGSKYLRAAQELLDEVINVGKGTRGAFTEGTNEKMKFNKESEDESSGGGESSVKRGADLSTAQKQELQMKKARLVNMLDEVEQRYRQYHHQMQLVVSSFERAAGFGTARSYTSLALRTIAKQFQRLKDAISTQIKSTSKGLGEEDCLGVKIEGSRLRYVDHHLRQQRALQQLGMMQHNAWRPQRGLPERAVSVLRAWLFEHFLHPYPKDSDKHMLAKQAGLTRSQVSNWFINARVRLWKPMVEEMYLEEIKEHEKNVSAESNEKNDKASGSSCSAPRESSTLLQMDQLKALPSKTEKSLLIQNASSTDFSNSTISMSPMRGPSQAQAGFSLICSSEMEGFAPRSPKKPRSIVGDMHNSSSSILSMDMEMKHGETSREINVNFGGERSLVKDGYPLITSTTSNGVGFGMYPIGDLGRFHPEHLAPQFNGNGVSLTLGLQYCDGLSLSTQQNFLSDHNIKGLEMGAGEPDFCGINSTSQNSNSGAGFENIDIQNRKRLAAQILPDFVA